jgi:hypothetical protein
MEYMQAPLNILAMPHRDLRLFYPARAENVAATVAAIWS